MTPDCPASGDMRSVVTSRVVASSVVRSTSHLTDVPSNLAPLYIPSSPTYPPASASVPAGMSLVTSPSIFMFMYSRLAQMLRAWKAASSARFTYAL